jgi:glycosyltransferase involved in cell wall biosynthesis
LLQAASLNHVKDQATLLRALAIVRRSVDARLDLVGEDTLGGRLQADATALGIADAVRFHGFVPHDELAPFHERAHLYVQSSRHEGGGIAVLEAAAAGLPIVGTRVGYVSDWHPRAAAAVAPGDADALAAAILTLLADGAQRAALALAAHDLALRHDVDSAAARLSGLYESLRAPHRTS